MFADILRHYRIGLITNNEACRACIDVCLEKIAEIDALGTPSDPALAATYEDERHELEHIMFCLSAPYAVHTPVGIRIDCGRDEPEFYYDDTGYACRLSGTPRTMNIDGDPVFYTGSLFWNGEDWEMEFS